MVLVFSLCQCVASHCRMRLKGRPTDRERAYWLHRCCTMVCRRLGLSLRVCGQPPQQGLLVSNHLSYLDILLYGATLPCVFVSKAEVRSWPMLGLLASLGGTVFVDRSSAVSAALANKRIEELLTAGVLVLIFPEGTSSDGSAVLRFHPSLFEPAVQGSVPATAAAIAYSGEPDALEKDLGYYGDISFGPHLLKTLELSLVSATIRFQAPPRIYADRKQAARETREEVIKLRGQGAGESAGKNRES